jgi:hypothetical protein
MPDPTFIPKSDAEKVLSLKQSRDNILVLIEEITAAPKPSYTIDGQTFKWAEYLKQLQESLQLIEDMIAGGDLDNYGEVMSTWYP